MKSGVTTRFPKPHHPSGVRTKMMVVNSNKFISDPRFEDVMSNLAQVEAGKRQYYRPIYSLHKWWARRPGALFRAIILLASRPDLANSLFETGGKNSISEYSSYFESYDLNDVIVFDPFMGGGTTLAEANRLGTKVVGCDINPVSYWIVRETLKSIDLDRLDQYFSILEQKAGERIKSLYRTTCVSCGTQRSEGIYAFWVRYVRCPYCHEDVYLYKRTTLNEGRSRTKRVSRSNPGDVFCPQCFALNSWHGEDSITCERCSAVSNPRVGSYSNGYYRCSRCKREGIALVETMKSGQRLKEKLIAIEYWCPQCRDRLYKAPDHCDIKKLDDIEQEFKATQSELLIPGQRIPAGSSSVRWRLHNYSYYREVFNARQLLAFNYLLKAINEIAEYEYRNAFITVFSNSLEYNNMMTPYNYPHRKLHHLFNYHAMPLTTTPVENVVWGVANRGAGTFVNCYGRYVRAKEYGQHPFDKFKNSFNKVQTMYSRQEKVSAQFVSSFDELKRTARGALLLCGDSSRVPDLPDKSVDFVVTDPPYFDNIHYSELSNFFYVWLSLLVKDPYFSAEYVPTEHEAIVNKGLDKGEEEYQQLLGAVFSECRRVLKDEGTLIFTFHHTKWRAWWTLLTALGESGFAIIDSFPVVSEYKVNPHVRNKQAMDMDLVSICQKRSVVGKSPLVLPKEILEHTRVHLSSILSNGGEGRLFLHFMGELLKTASSAWGDGQQVDYDWFSDALSHFDGFIADLETNQENRSTGDSSEPVQARLF